MPSDHPRTPQSPQTMFDSAADIPGKLATSPRPTASLPTPAHSVNGSMASISSEIAAEATSQPEELSNKRKRDVEDNGDDREQKKIHVEDSRISIEDLHLDVGTKYKLCRTPHPAVRPHLSEDFFELYSLKDTAASVARFHPNGQKNALRKTYKGFIKNAGLAGQFDVVKKDLEAPDTLFAMMTVPEEEWVGQWVRGKEIERGIPANASVSLGKAMTMARGVVPRDRWNPAVLGELGGPPTKVEITSTVHHAAKATAPQTMAVPRAAKTEPPRPKRSVKKRSYGDSSFEGYGEGYLDDDLQDGGYSTGDGDDRGARKRPKKTTSNHNFQGPVRQNSYGPGMVGA